MADPTWSAGGGVPEGIQKGCDMISVFSKDHSFKDLLKRDCSV